MSAPILRPSDFGSDLWRRLSAIWEVQLADHLDRLAQPGIPEREADHLRGRVEELKFNLARPEYATRSDRMQEIEPGDVSALY